MMSRKLFFCAFVFYCVLSSSASLLQAGYIYPLEIFTNNGSFCDSGDLDLYVAVSKGEAGRVNFTFYNESLIDSSIARIYFDDDSVLDISAITEGAGTSFSQHATPRNLPSGNSLEPPFVATEGFSFNSQPPRPQNGVNPGEWLRITFDINGNTFAAVINGLDTGAIRIGTHIIALPDGSSESAIAIPEPVTIALLGLGGLVLTRRRRKKICRDLG
ncbi:MAG: PEP-CTERM sorting domain-containing protein [Planctomycetota bacterium]|jgi:hypothetical protein